MENQDLFETPPAPLSNAPTEPQPVAVAEKPKKAKKEMTEEKKAELINRLTKAREKLAENREAKKALKESEKKEKKSKPESTPAVVPQVTVPVVAPVAPTPTQTVAPVAPAKKIRKPAEPKPDLHGEKLDRIHGAISELLEYKKNKHAKKPVEPERAVEPPKPEPKPVQQQPEPAIENEVFLPSFRSISNNRFRY